jgi:low temperature requirement protein LtrA
MSAESLTGAPPAPAEALPRYFRPGAPGGEQRTTWLELFFDLVFVFAVTQLSHLLLNDLTWAGAGKAAVLLFVAWWAWNYTTWMTNWFDPDATPVRLLLLAVMLAALLMSIAIPQAFGDRAALFAGAYVGLQVLRNGFATAVAPPRTAWRDNFGRILIWSMAAGVLWIVGAAVSESARIGIWLVALAIELAGPATLYWLPRRGSTTTLRWPIDPGHFAERFQLFVIIALGESIVVTGATASALHMDAARVTAIALAFAISACLWWLYFDTVARIIGGGLAASEDPGRVARDAFTYFHIPIVAGIILSAVGDELLIAHPGHGLSAGGLVALCGGPALYLIGHILLRLSFTHQISRTRSRATLALLPCGLLGIVLPALATAALVAAVLVTLIAVEAHRRRAAAAPAPSTI